MKLKARCLLILFVTWSAIAQAQGGYGGGNGGNAVVCRQPGNPNVITSVELFDYWEMNQVEPQFGNVELGSPGLSVAEKIEIALKRIEAFDPVRAVKSREVAKEILSKLDQYLSDNVEQFPVEDDHERVHPQPPCQKVQFAVQLNTPTPGRRRFQINRALYTSAVVTNATRAGLLLHEIFYRDAISRGQNNSDRVRPFNYRVATGYLSQVNPTTIGSYDRFLKEAGFDYEQGCKLRYLPGIATPFNLRGSDSRANSDPAGSLISEGQFAFCGVERELNLGGLRTSVGNGSSLKVFGTGDNLSYQFRSSKWSFNTSLYQCHANGSSSNITVDHFGHPIFFYETSCEGTLKIEIGSRFYDCQSSTYGFFVDGRIKECQLRRSEQVQLKDGSKMKLNAGAGIGLNPDGSLSWLSGSWSEHEFTVSGSEKRFVFIPTEYGIQFDNQGKVTQGFLARPITRTYLGVTYSIGVIQHPHDGKAYGEWVTRMFDYRHFGLRALHETDFEIDPVTNEFNRFCTEMGFSEEAGIPHSSYHESFHTHQLTDVREYEKFYSISVNQETGHFDEKLDVISQVNCMVSFEFDL